MNAAETGNAAIALELAGERLLARGAGTLWLPAHRALVVSDLHLGKSERNARRGGGFWPPYETRETLRRLAAEIETLDPAHVVSLGDSFDDGRCAEELDDADRAMLGTLAAGRDWTWVRGNHDPAPHGLAGRCVAALRLGGLVLRHIAEPGAQDEVSGHYHPKVTLWLRGRRIVRRCFVHDEHRIILPAFGAYTGGLDCTDPAFGALVSPEAVAIATGPRPLGIPLARTGRPAGRPARQRPARRRVSPS